MITTNWNDVAEEYFKRDFSLQEWKYSYQYVLELLEDLENKTVLDYGCGAGKFSRLLSSKGANVIAVDPCKKMIDLALSQKKENIEYQLLEDTIFKSKALVDLAVCNFVFIGIPSDEQILQILKSIFNNLKPNSFLVALDPHPNRINRNPSEIYLNGMTKPVYDYWRPKEKYVSLFKESGFYLEALLETTSTEFNQPSYLILKGRK